MSELILQLEDLGLELTLYVKHRLVGSLHRAQVLDVFVLRKCDKNLVSFMTNFHSLLETVKVGAYLDSFNHSLLLGYGEVLLGYSLLESVNSSPRGVQIRRFRHQIVLHSWKLNLRVFTDRISDRPPFDILGLRLFSQDLFDHSPDIWAS